MGMLKEFKEFTLRGNVIDLAVAVVIGAAFAAIVKAFNESIISPLIALILGELSLAALYIKVGNTIFPVGIFIQSVIDFILIAFVLFLVIKGINLRKKKEVPAPAVPPEEIVLLREIRDALKK